MTLSSSSEPAWIVVYCPKCMAQLQRIRNAGNVADQTVAADAPCRVCLEAERDRLRKALETIVIDLQGDWDWERLNETAREALDV